MHGLVHELRKGLWHWQAPHPDWNPRQRWPQHVSSYAIDDGTHLILVDPLAVPREVLDLAGHRTPVVVLAAPWHERGTRSLVERLRATVYSPPPDTVDDLVRKFGVTRERAAAAPTDLTWLVGSDGAKARWIAAGDRLPLGIEVFPGREENDLVLWVESLRAVIPGDTVVDFGSGLQVNDWLRGGITRDEVLGRLRPLLDLPVDLVLPTHGAPTDRAALERALA